MIRRLYKQLISWVVFSALALSALPIYGQAKRPGKRSSVEPVKAVSAQACNGGWSGFVTFKKTLNETYDEKVKNRIRGTTHHVTSRDYKYEGGSHQHRRIKPSVR